MSGREILLCVTGGIAAYKAAALVSRLVQSGASVTVAMTPAARKFIGQATFEGLTGREVARSLWGGDNIRHLSLTQQADLAVVAPATANCLAKLAGGLADDLVSTLLLGADCPVLLAPAMNENMWRHPAVQRNVAWLSDNGFHLVGPGSGWQACRAVGPGRMSEPDEILSEIVNMLRSAPARKRASRATAKR